MSIALLSSYLFINNVVPWNRVQRHKRLTDARLFLNKYFLSIEVLAADQARSEVIRIG
jgi:hypothetical protein